MPTEVYGHPAYNDAVREAARLARRNDTCMAVWFDGVAIFVRPSNGTAPPDSELVCVAQIWDDKTVQLRFKGAHSEWVHT